MKSLRDELLEKYDIDINLTSCYSFINSYARDATKPIIFTHYTHEQNFPGHEQQSKNKEYCSVFIFLSGNFSFITNNNMYTPSYGDAIFFREHEDFVAFFHSIGHIDYYEISFYKEFFEKAACSDMFSAPFYNRELHENNMIVLDNRNRNIIIEKLQEIEHITKEDYHHANVLSYSYIIQIMDILSYNISYNQNTPIPMSRIPEKLKDAIIYIHGNFKTIESISEISDSCGISNTYLEKMFKTHLSCTPIEYITNHRISFAKYLLANGASVIDACFKSGFNNYTYFISKFKKITGSTPHKAKNNKIKKS